VKTASYGLVIAVGLGVTGVVVYTVFNVSFIFGLTGFWSCLVVEYIQVVNEILPRVKSLWLLKQSWVRSRNTSAPMEESGEQCIVACLHYLLRNRLLSVCVCVVGGGGCSPPPPPLAGSITIYAKTTVHCSPNSSRFGTMESEGRQMRKCWIQFIKTRPVWLYGI
jgi:hypothetical protein